MPLSRKSLSDDSFKQRMIDESPGAMSLMDADDFEACRQDILAKASEAGVLWVFAYGSLIWNPIIDIAETRRATLPGYGRRFCVWAPIGRGTPERPGLWLGLDAVESGSVSGVALRIDPTKWDAESLILWRREMISGVYRPTWLNLHTDNGDIPACVFVANSEHERYAAEIDTDAKVRAIATASGSLGTCRAYLDSLAEELAKADMRDAYIERLAASVKAYDPK